MLWRHLRGSTGDRGGDGGNARAGRALVGVDARRLRDLDDALRAEGVVRVDEEDAPRGAAVLLGELGLDRERESELCFPAAGIAE